MLYQKILILKCLYCFPLLVFEYRNRASTVMVQKITTLHHERFYDPMKLRIFVSLRILTKFKFSSAELPEVFSCLWRDISKELIVYSSSILPSNLYIHKYNRVLR